MSYLSVNMNMKTKALKVVDRPTCLSEVMSRSVSFNSQEKRTSHSFAFSSLSSQSSPNISTDPRTTNLPLPLAPAKTKKQNANSLFMIVVAW